MLYDDAGRIIQEVEEKKSTIKSLVMTSKFSNKKALYGLTCETLKFSTVLNEVLNQTRLLKLEKSLKSPYVAQCLLYDFLIGKGLKLAGKYKQCILSHKAALKAQLERLKIKAKVTDVYGLISEKILKTTPLPRYVRVNLLKTSIADVLQYFARVDGFVLGHCAGISYQRFIELVRDLQPKQFLQDPHIIELLIFPSGTDLHDHVLYKRGDIILQDKASCLPAVVLNPPPGSHVIDCCAAPGNKTSCVAAIMKNKGKIFSFDLDPKRLATMNTLTLKAGVLCAKLINRDFLKVDPNDPLYSQVEYIIVDPSCSGSGIVSRMNHITDDDKSNSNERLEKLARFQMSILKHALTFPKAKQVVYSTCSIHEEENENVVWDVLKQVKDKFGLDYILPEFPNRGKPGSFPYYQNCIRMEPEKDLTNGFFVACFHRQAQTVKTDLTTESDVKDNKYVSSDAGFEQCANKKQRKKCKHRDLGLEEEHTNNFQKIHDVTEKVILVSPFERGTTCTSLVTTPTRITATSNITESKEPCHSNRKRLAGSSNHGDAQEKPKKKRKRNKEKVKLQFRHESDTSANKTATSTKFGSKIIKNQNSVSKRKKKGKHVPVTAVV